jgi:hypothetical protein
MAIGPIDDAVAHQETYFYGNLDGQEAGESCEQFYPIAHEDAGRSTCLGLKLASHRNLEAVFAHFVVARLSNEALDN